MPLTRTRKDATGALLRADKLYQCVNPYSAGTKVYTAETTLHGDHEAVREAPSRWVATDVDSETKRRLELEARFPAPPDHSPPTPKVREIPPERQVYAVDSFTVGPDYVQRGQILDIKHRLVKRYPELFRRPPQPVNPEAA